MSKNVFAARSRRENLARNRLRKLVKTNHLVLKISSFKRDIVKKKLEQEHSQKEKYQKTLSKGRCFAFER